MQFDQLLRRLAWRTRRRLRPGADNEPVVTIEHAPTPAPRRAGVSVMLLTLGLLLIAASAFLTLRPG